jgi:hypothetical protein
MNANFRFYFCRVNHLIRSFVLAAVSLLFVSAAFPFRLEKAFEALSVYNYFKAKELFYKSLKADSAAAAYGLSVIYSRSDNPFTDLDSAHQFVNIAERNWPLLDEKKVEKYSELGVDSIAVGKQATRIDSLIFHLIEASPEIAVWENYIEKHDDPTFSSRAISKRNALAFNRAKEMDSSSAYQQFLKTYPDAAQAAEANKLFNLRKYEEMTTSGKVSSFTQFIDSFPESPYVAQAEQNVYAISTRSGKVEDLEQFVKSYPDNPFVEEAWRKIYALEVKEITAQSIAEFTLSYPGYPYMDELKQEFDLAVTYFYPYTDGDYWGFIDEKGEIAIPLKYEWVEPFNDGVAMVGVPSGVAYISKTSQELTDKVFDDGFTFSKGFAVVEKDGEYGVINRLGQYVVEPQYDDIGEFSDGLFYVESEGKYGYIDEWGEVVIPLQFSDALDFHSGLAVVTNADDLKALIDKSGNLLTPFAYEWIESFKSFEEPVRFRKSDRYGLLNRGGLEMSDTSYQYLGEFSGGFALAANDGKYGFLNVRGDTAIDFRYSFDQRALIESKFSGGYAKVFQEKKVGIIDSTGQKVFPAIFEDIGKYEGNLIPIKKRGKWGYSDLNVDLAIPYQFSSADSFKDSLAIASKKEMFGVIDREGNQVVPLNYRSLEWVNDLLIARDTAFGLISTDNEILVSLAFKEARVVDHRVIEFKDFTGKMVYYDYRGRAILRTEE